jgi:serine/threonine protein kinase
MARRTAGVELRERACPTQQELRELSSGKLDEGRLEVIAGHVGACVSCQAFLAANRDESDTVIRQIRAACAPDVIIERGELSRIESELLARGPREESYEQAKDTRARPFPQSFDGYELGEFIGQGGMGTVYSAHQTRLRRPVVVKFLSPKRLGDADSIERFQREMEASGRFTHPHVILTHDAGEADGHFYIVMEQVNGVDLRQLLAWNGPLPVPAACELARQAAEGLACAHQHQVIHRDIKPSNLLVSRDGQVKVLDLGLAFLGRPDETHGRAGTADFMAPEQWSGAPVDARTDIYALGCTLYKLLTGRTPHEVTSVEQTAERQPEVPFPLSELRPDAPEALGALLIRMVAFHPADRIASMDEVVAALIPFSAGAELKSLVRPNGFALQDTKSRRHLSTLLSRSQSVLGRGTAWRGVGRAIIPLCLTLFSAAWMTGMLPVERLARTTNLLTNDPVLIADDGGWKLRASFSTTSDGSPLATSGDFAAWLCSAKTPLGYSKLRLQLSAADWLDGTGVFFAAVPDAEDSAWRYQAIMLKPILESGEPLALDLYWRSVETTNSLGGQALAMQRIPWPDPNDPHELELELGFLGLKQVSWDGKLLTELAQPVTSPPAYVPGGLGLLNGCGTTRFHHFTLTH